MKIRAVSSFFIYLKSVTLWPFFNPCPSNFESTRQLGLATIPPVKEELASKRDLIQLAYGCQSVAI
jgi:hypothetical protein